MAAAIKLLVGLGNPGPQYEATRHNAGHWLLEALARQGGAQLSPESRFHGLTARIDVAGLDLRLLYPTTFMNRSGLAVGAMAQFFKVAPEQILVCHDELDLPCGIARFKQGGGHGGHNGLRDIIRALGNNPNFHRLRIGIDHPGSSAEVVNYVLNKPSHADRQRIDDAIDACLDTLPAYLKGDSAKAMNQLHSFKAS